MNGFVGAIVQFGAILFVVLVPGYVACAAFVQAGPARVVAERLAWALAIGALLIAGMVPLSFLVGMRPGWLPLLLLAALGLIATWRFRLKSAISTVEGWRQPPAITLLALALTLVGVTRYFVVALAEPMWITDYLSIWGLKGKTIYGAGEVPDRLFSSFTLRYSLPQYPLGLPFLYAGSAFLLGRWDDHAMALLFPVLQIATLLALYGWLRRRGASRTLGLGATAPLSLFHPLYADTVGMAEVPLSFAILLFGVSLADGLDSSGTAALKRLALSSFLLVSIKNEGWFVVLAAVLIVTGSSLVKRRRPPFALLAALLLPGAAVRLLHVLRRGIMPLQAFDFGYLSPSRFSELAARALRTMSVALDDFVLPAWPALLALLVLGACGRRMPSARVLLAVLGLCVAAYTFLPALSPDPLWQVRLSFRRTVAALAPLLTAALALRLVPPYARSVAAVAPAAPSKLLTSSIAAGPPETAS